MRPTAALRSARPARDSTHPTRHRGAVIAALTVGALLISVPTTADAAVAEETTSTVTVRNYPKAVVFTPDGASVWVLVNAGIDIVDPSTLAVTGRIDLPGVGSSLAIAPDGRTAYVTQSLSDDVTVVDVGTLTISGSIALPAEPFGLAVSPDGSTLYAGLPSEDEVGVVDLSDSTSTTVSGFSDPAALSTASDGRVYVANQGSGELGIIGTDGSTSRSDLFAAPQNAVAAAPDGIAWVGAGDESGGSVYALATNVSPIVQSIQIPAATAAGGLDASPDGDTVWVPFPYEGTVVGYSAADGSPLDTRSLGSTSGPLRLDVSPDGDLVAVALSGDSAVALITPEIDGIGDPDPEPSPQPTAQPAPSAAPTATAAPAAPRTPTRPGTLAATGIDGATLGTVAALTLLLGLGALAGGRRHRRRNA